MPIGEFIKDRWMVKAIKNICQERGIDFVSYSDDWLLELSKDTHTARILGYKFSLNNGVAAQSAEDKVATSMILAAHQIPALTHALVRTKDMYYDKWLKKDWQQVVVKPLVGTSGHGVRLFKKTADASEWIKSQTIDAWAVSPFIKIKREVRLIVLDGNVLLAYEKIPVVINGLSMFNLGLGATPKNIQAPDDMKQLAIGAQHVMGLRLAAIDVIEQEDGAIMVLEINDGIMMEHYARASKENQDKAYGVYTAIVVKVLQERSV